MPRRFARVWRLCPLCPPLACGCGMALLCGQHDDNNGPIGGNHMLAKLTSAIAAAVAVAALALPGGAAAQSGEPIKIGFSMALTGGLAANGKSGLLAQKIWE